MNIEDKKLVASQSYALKHFIGLDNLHAIKDAWLAGFEAGTPKWIDVEEEKPEYNKPVLLKYIKGKQEVITQGYFQDVTIETAKMNLKSAQESGKYSENGIKTVDFWYRCGYGETYFDYADRQIQYLGAKTSKNKVIAWQEIM